MTAPASDIAAPRGRIADRTWLIALGTALWGTSALMRDPLASQMAAPTIVFFEHLVIVAFLLPWLPAAIRAFRLADARLKAAVILIGGGASALATTLFTMAFRFGDPVTPPVLQKLQPLFAILLAALILGERVTRRFPMFAVPALVGTWLLAFADPFGIELQSLQAAGLAVGAAVLWASGTVLGRFAGSRLRPSELLVLRFAFGLPAALVIALAMDAPIAFTPLTVGNVLLLVTLALIVGVLALALYYQGLRGTPASRATIAELAFPLTAAAVGVGVLGRTLDVSQWIGFGLILASITGMSLYERSARGRRTPSVRVPVSSSSP